jgi:type II secretion system protein G
MVVRRECKGFTLIELLIVVAIIGIIAAIAIPNLLNAIDRGKQKRSMADMRSIGTAVEAYAVDNNTFPVTSSMATLSSSLVPQYVKALPTSDGWNNTFAVDAAATQYTLTSYGSDALPGGCVSGTMTSLFTQDICFANGQFIQYPMGAQK